MANIRCKPQKDSYREKELFDSDRDSVTEYYKKYDRYDLPITVPKYLPINRDYTISEDFVDARIPDIETSPYRNYRIPAEYINARVSSFFYENSFVNGKYSVDLYENMYDEYYYNNTRPWKIVKISDFAKVSDGMGGQRVDVLLLRKLFSLSYYIEEHDFSKLFALVRNALSIAPNGEEYLAKAEADIISDAIQIKSFKLDELINNLRNSNTFVNRILNVVKN